MIYAAVIHPSRTVRFVTAAQVPAVCAHPSTTVVRLVPLPFTKEIPSCN